MVLRMPSVTGTPGWISPCAARLIDMLTANSVRLVDKWLQIGVDHIGFHTDIGTQKALMISPASFRKYIKPMFSEIFERVRNAGTHVYLSSDGHLLEIVDDLIECGVSVHDPQFRADKTGVVHVAIGKASMTADKITENARTLLNEVAKKKPADLKGEFVKSVAVSSTMGPGVKVVLE